MSEPNLAYSSLAAESRPSDAKSTLDAEAVDVAAVTLFATTAPQSTDLLQQYLDTWAAEHHENNAIDPAFVAAVRQQATAALEAQRQRWEHEQETLRTELRQARSLSHEQSERIRHLEQALDQSLTSLGEMQLQVVNQHLLEAQLASTEEISNIQQQAIGRLKLQLGQQQQALTAQLNDTQARDRALQTLLNTMAALTQEQQQALEQLQAQLACDRADIQTYQQRLEEQLERLQVNRTAQQEQTLALEPPSPDARTLAEPLATRLEQAQAHVNTLSQILSDRQIALRHLDAELQQAYLALQEQQALLERLQQSRLPRPAATVTIAPATAVSELGAPAIAAELVAAQAKIVALEAQAAKQTTAQAMLRHACQELEEERDRQQARMTELESQTTDMQEQILRQAQQASEYETAIQHWKDRCFSSQSDVLKLKTSLEHALPNPPADVSDVLAALLAAADETEPSSPALLKTTSFNREPRVDLPDFLLRRRNHKTRRS